MTAAVDTSVCARCGMPLGYDALVQGADARRAEGLCVHCSQSRDTGVLDPIAASPAVLNLLISTYLRGRPAVRGLAALVQKLGWGPAPCSAWRA